MNTKLTLNLDKDVIEEAKTYAKDHKVSLSKLIENYLNSLTTSKDRRRKVSPLVESLTGVIPSEAQDDKKGYQEFILKRLHISSGAFASQIKDSITLYHYGLIVFMPHRQGWLGIRNGYNSYGVFDNPEYVQIEQENANPKHFYNSETLAYFMGSGDDDTADKVDKESFQHLKLFKDNEKSVMIATKAFGMGIDRITMLKYGITDIRDLFVNDVRMLKQFAGI